MEAFVRLNVKYIVDSCFSSNVQLYDNETREPFVFRKLEKFFFVTSKFYEATLLFRMKSARKTMSFSHTRRIFLGEILMTDIARAIRYIYGSCTTICVQSYTGMLLFKLIKPHIF